MSRNLSRFEKTAKNLLWRVPGLLFSKKGNRQALDLSEIKSVLVVRPDRLGDVVLSTPVYASIKASLPGVRLTALVDRSNTGLLANNPNIDRIIEWDAGRPWSILPALRKETFDLAFCLHKTFSATASLMILFSRSRFRVGYQHQQNAWMLDHPVAIDDSPRHEIENDLELLIAVGMTDIQKTPQLFFSDEERKKVEAMLAEKRKHPDRPAILVKPGTRVPEWGWQLEKFRAVTERLLQTQAAEVFLISGPGEDALTDHFLRGMQDPPVRLPPLSVNELALTIQKADLLLCNHTGIMHLASAVNTPVVAIFKHGEIARWGPVHTPGKVLEERNGDSLAPETVLQSIQELLQGAKSPHREARKP